MNGCRKFVNFGIEEEFNYTYGTGTVSSLYPVNSHERIVSTTRQLWKVEGSIIKKTLSYSFLVSCYIKKYSLIVGYTLHGAELCILDEKDMEHPILEHFRTDTTSVFHMIYSEKSSLLILVGSGVSVWNIEVQMPTHSISMTKPLINISLKARFADHYETVILNPPVFDYRRELIFLPIRAGIAAFNMDGELVKQVTRFPASNTSVFAYNEKMRRLLTTEEKVGICLWDFDGYPCGTFSAGASAIFSMHFIDEEHVVIMNAKGFIFILNLKTGKAYHVYTADAIPSRLIVLRDPVFSIALVFTSTIVYLKVTVPWNLWIENVIMPKEIRRIPKRGEAARMMILTNDSFIKLYSPKNGQIVTCASPHSTAVPYRVFYDRGCILNYTKRTNEGDFDFVTRAENRSVLNSEFIEVPGAAYDCEVVTSSHRDELFVVLTNGFISGFDTGVDPSNEVMSVDLKAGSLTSFYDRKGRWGYAICSPKGEAYLLDYDTMHPWNRFRVTPMSEEACNVFFDPLYNFLVFLYLKEIYVYDLNALAMIQRIPARGSKCSYLFGGNIFVGMENGDIDIYEIGANGVTPHSGNGDRNEHDDRITGFAFSPYMWLSSSINGSLTVWNYDFTVIASTRLPEPIYSCELLNGTRNILVGTNSEIMIIGRDFLFGRREFDSNMDLIDNFDRKQDVLVSDIFAPSFSYHEEEQVEKVCQPKKMQISARKRDKLRAMLKQQHDKWELDPETVAILNKMNKEDELQKKEKKDKMILEMQKLTNEERKVLKRKESKEEEPHESEEQPEGKRTDRKHKHHKKNRISDEQSDDDETETKRTHKKQAKRSKESKQRLGRSTTSKTESGNNDAESEDYDYGDSESEDIEYDHSSADDADYTNNDNAKKGKEKKTINNKSRENANSEVDDDNEQSEDIATDDDVEPVQTKRGKHGKIISGEAVEITINSDSENEDKNNDESNDNEETEETLMESQDYQTSTFHGETSRISTATSTMNRTSLSDDESTTHNSKPKQTQPKKATKAKSKAKKAGKGKKGKKKKPTPDTPAPSAPKQSQPIPEKRAGTPPCIRKKFEEDFIEQLKLKRSHSRIYKAKHMFVVPSPVVILDQKALIKLFARGKKELLPVLKMIKKGTVKNTQRKAIASVVAPNPGQQTAVRPRPVFTVPNKAETEAPVKEVQHVHEPKSARRVQTGVVKPPRVTYYNTDDLLEFRVNEVQKTAVFNLTANLTMQTMEAPVESVVLDDFDEMMEEVTEMWNRVPITARVVNYNDTKKEETDVITDRLADAVIAKVPMMRTLTKFTPRNASVSKCLYKSAHRPKIIEPLGHIDKSVHIRNKFNRKTVSIRSGPYNYPY